MIIKTIPVGMIGTNCYIAGCPETKEAVVIDPGDEEQKIMKVVNDNKLKVVAIINTHGHWDHVGANGAIKEKTGAPLMIHEDDATYLTDSKLNLASMLIGKGEKSPQADKVLRDGDEIKFGNQLFKVLHTPGHTPGGICLIGDKEVFAGDTLFAGSIGRTDLAGGNYDTLIRSIKDKVLTIGDEYVVYPGHGPATRIGDEKNGNPFLR